MIYGIGKINAVRLNSFKKQKFAETRNLKRYNKALYQQDLQGVDWVNFLTPLENEPNKMVATFQDVFESLPNMHAPCKISKVRNEFTPCLISSVRDIMTKRDKVKKAAIKKPFAMASL